MENKEITIQLTQKQFQELIRTVVKEYTVPVVFRQPEVEASMYILSNMLFNRFLAYNTFRE